LVLHEERLHAQRVGGSLGGGIGGGHGSVSRFQPHSKGRRGWRAKNAHPNVIWNAGDKREVKNA
jgi:hypothetical protein